MDIKASFISYICNQITNIEVKMVLEIRLSNMFSFRDEVTLDLQAAKIQTKKARELEGNLFSVDGEQMLKSVALFGANASDFYPVPCRHQTMSTSSLPACRHPSLGRTNKTSCPSPCHGSTFQYPCCLSASRG